MNADFGLRSDVSRGLGKSGIGPSRNNQLLIRCQSYDCDLGILRRHHAIALTSFVSKWIETQAEKLETCAAVAAQAR